MGKPSRSKAKKGKGRSKQVSAAQPEPSQPLRTAVWQPGVDSVEEGDVLDYDPTAYHCLVAFSIDWPCLRWVTSLSAQLVLGPLTT